MAAPRCLIACVMLIAVGSAAGGCGAGQAHDTSRTRPAASTPQGRSATTQISDNTSEPVVTIGARTITRGTLEHWVAIATHGEPGAPDPPEYTGCIEYLRSSETTAQTTEQLRGTCRQQYDELLKPALGSLIHARWLIAEAGEEGLKVDEAKLLRESSPSGPRGQEVLRTLSTTGETASDVKVTSIVSQLTQQIRRRLERKVPAVTRAQISIYYERHRNSFVVPEHRDLLILRTASRAAVRKAKREIEGGKSFASIVARTSLAQPVSARKGLLRGLTPYNFPELLLSNAIFHARLKTLGGPIDISLGHYLFEVLRSVPSRQRTLSEASGDIAQQLHQRRRDRILSHFIATFRKKWKSRTSCRPGYVVEYCRQYRSAKAGPQEGSGAL